MLQYVPRPDAKLTVIDITNTSTYKTMKVRLRVQSLFEVCGPESSSGKCHCSESRLSLIIMTIDKKQQPLPHNYYCSLLAR